MSDRNKCVFHLGHNMKIMMPLWSTWKKYNDYDDNNTPPRQNRGEKLLSYIMKRPDPKADVFSSQFLISVSQNKNGQAKEKKRTLFIWTDYPKDSLSK